MYYCVAEDEQGSVHYFKSCLLLHYFYFIEIIQQIMDQYQKHKHQEHTPYMRPNPHPYNPSPPPLPNTPSISAFQIPLPISDPNPRYISPNQLSINPSYLNYVSHHGYYPNNQSDRVQNPSPHSPGNRNQSMPGRDIPGHLRMRAAEAEGIRRQQQSNKIRRNKEREDMLFENSAIIQNQIEHYPYGNIHGNIMSKIIERKNAEDRNNEDILCRFQREAEEFKKSKSKHIKKMNLESREVEEHSQRQRRESNKRERLSKGYLQPLSINSPIRGREPPVDHSSFEESYDTQYQFTPKPRSKNVPSVIQISSPLKSPKKPQYHLYPLTNQGEDGLKLIRRNLRLRSESQQERERERENNKRLRIEYNTQDEPIREIQELQQSIKQLSSMMKVNRDNLSLGENERTPVGRQKESLKRSKFANRTSQNSMIDPVKMKKYLERMQKSSDSQLKGNKQYLQYLSEVLK